MRLTRHKVGSRSFNHPFYTLELPDAIPEERKAGLISEIRGGSQQAAHLVVLSHLRLALNIVGRYLTVLGDASRSDDLVGAATEGLCYGVNKIKDEGLSHTNLTGYLTEIMHRFISEAIARAPVVHVPPGTKRPKDAKKPATQELTDTVIEAQFDRKINTASTIELKEIMDKIIHSDLERTIVDLRIAGYTDLDIANQTDMCNTSIYMIRRELGKRFDNLFGDSENVD